MNLKRYALLDLKDDFIDALHGESIGGNAGPQSSAVNMVVDKDGVIKYIGNYSSQRPELVAGMESGELIPIVIRLRVTFDETSTAHRIVNVYRDAFKNCEDIMSTGLGQTISKTVNSFLGQ